MTHSAVFVPAPFLLHRSIPFMSSTRALWPCAALCAMTKADRSQIGPFERNWLVPLHQVSLCAHAYKLMWGRRFGLLFERLPWQAVGL